MVKSFNKYYNEVWTIYNEFNSSLPSSLCWGLSIDAKGRKWIGCGTNNGGLVKIDGENWEVLNTDNSELPNNHVHSITFDKYEQKWIGTLQSGLAVFNDTTWTIYNTQNSDIPSNEILCVTIDSENKKWVGTWHHGFAIFDGIKWRVYNTDNSPLPHNSVIDIEIDSNENMWIGTTFGGVSVYDGKNWVNIGEEEGLSDHSALCFEFENDTDVWIGTWTFGVSLLKNGVNVVSIDNEKKYNFSNNFKLYQNYPNPFNPSTTLSYSLPLASNVKLEIYDVMGRMIKSFTTNSQASGTHKVVWDGTNNNGVRVATGIYIYRFEATSIETNEHFVKSEKLMLMK